MSGERVFLDTNILVYAHDADAGRKHECAASLVAALWQTPDSACLSVQVLQEFYVNVVRKGVSASEARAAVEDYLSWPVVENDIQLLRDAMVVRERWQLSLRDALIIAAAQRARVAVIYSEDLSDGQDYGGVVVRNPFAANSSSRTPPKPAE